MCHRLLCEEATPRCLHMLLETALAAFGGGEASTAFGGPSPVSGISRLWDHLGQFAHSVTLLPALPRRHNYCQIAFFGVCVSHLTSHLSASTPLPAHRARAKAIKEGEPGCTVTSLRGEQQSSAAHAAPGNARESFPKKPPRPASAFPRLPGKSPVWCPGIRNPTNEVGVTFQIYLHLEYISFLSFTFYK